MRVVQQDLPGDDDNVNVVVDVVDDIVDVVVDDEDEDDVGEGRPAGPA